MEESSGSALTAKTTKTLVLRNFATAEQYGPRWIIKEPSVDHFCNLSADGNYNADETFDTELEPVNFTSGRKKDLAFQKDPPKIT